MLEVHLPCLLGEVQVLLISGGEMLPILGE